MDINGRILTAMRKPPRRTASIVALCGITAVVSSSSLATGFVVFAGGTIWLYATKLKIPAMYFANAPNFKTAAEAICEIEEALLGASDSLEFSYVTRLNHVRAKSKFVVACSNQDELIVTPERYWSHLDGVYSTGETKRIVLMATYNDVGWYSSFEHGDEIVKREWRETTKTGERDYRYKDNELFTIRRLGISLTLINGTAWDIRFPSRVSRDEALNSFSQLLGVLPSEGFEPPIEELRDDPGDGDEGYQDDDEYADGYGTDAAAAPAEWHHVLGVNEDSSRQVIKQARDHLIKGLHPDRLKSVEDISPEFEQYANKRLVEINAAYKSALAAVRARG